MKLGQPPDEAAIAGLPGGGFISNTLRWGFGVISAGFNLEHDVETSRHGTIKALGTIAERGRTVPIGEWIDIPYGTVGFAGNGGTWTVQAANQSRYRYMLSGKTLTLDATLLTTSVAGAVSSVLQLPMPPGFTSHVSIQGMPFTYSDAGTFGTGLAQVLASTSVVRLFRAGFGVWTASVNATDVYVKIPIEVA